MNFWKKSKRPSTPASPSFLENYTAIFFRKAPFKDPAKRSKICNKNRIENDPPLRLRMMCLWQYLPLKCIRFEHLKSKCTGFVAKYQLRSLIKILFWNVLFICPSRPQAGEGGLKKDKDTPKPVVPNPRRQDWPILPGIQGHICQLD